MPFIIPEPLPSDKSLSDASWKSYKGRLNTLANVNDAWSTVEGLKANAIAICDHIDEQAGDSEKDRVKKRGILQAIFSVLDIEYRKTKNPFYKYWQTVTPLKTGEGDAWKLRKNYHP